MVCAVLLCTPTKTSAVTSDFRLSWPHARTHTHTPHKPQDNRRSVASVERRAATARTRRFAALGAVKTNRSARRVRKGGTREFGRCVRNCLRARRHRDRIPTMAKRRRMAGFEAAAKALGDVREERAPPPCPPCCVLCVMLYIRRCVACCICVYVCIE